MRNPSLQAPWWLQPCRLPHNLGKCGNDAGLVQGNIIARILSSTWRDHLLLRTLYRCSTFEIKLSCLVHIWWESQGSKARLTLHHKSNFVKDTADHHACSPWWSPSLTPGNNVTWNFSMIIYSSCCILKVWKSTSTSWCRKLLKLVRLVGPSFLQHGHAVQNSRALVVEVMAERLYSSGVSVIQDNIVLIMTLVFTRTPCHRKCTRITVYEKFSGIPSGNVEH